MKQEDVKEAAQTVKSGGTVIYPTETCYGLGCDATDEGAVARVYEIKERPREKQLTVIVDSIGTARTYCDLTEKEEALCDAFMPGPLTLVAEKNDRTPDLLNESFVFRVPGNRIARRLAAEAEVPVVATSANISGMESSYSVEAISDRVRREADTIIDAGELERTPSSTIVRVVDGAVDVLREGPIGRSDMEDVLD